jgi:hypothetical protein
MDDWTVWGDSPEPVLEASEEDCKAFVKNNYSTRLDLYLSDPSGVEWDYNGATDEWEKL